MARSIGILGANLRRIRAERGLSMSELARASGVAKGTLSKLEAGSGNPTVETLWSLADALGVGLGALLAEQVPQMRVVNPTHSVWLRNRQMEGRLVDRLAGRGSLELWEARFVHGNPFHTDHVPGHVPGTVEHWFILSGRMQLGPEDGDKVELRAGDYIRFLIDRPFVFEAVDGDVHLMMLVNYPRGEGSAEAG